MSRKTTKIQRKRNKLHAQIAAFAAKYAGTQFDLARDPEEEVDAAETETSKEMQPSDEAIHAALELNP